MKTKEERLLFIIENFYLCTSMPIKVINSIGKTIFSIGIDCDFSEDLIYNNVIDLKYEEQYSKNTFKLIEHLNLNFAICQYSFNNENIFFILGPFHKKKVENSKFIYRPLHCIPHIIQLLYNFNSDESTYEYISNNIYSFHIKKALEYINENYKKSITLDDIVSYININKSYFCSLFKKEVGKTYSQYINSLRIKKSEELLLNTEMSLLNISLAVGFNNQNYYNNLFKKEHNMSPLQFKNKYFN